MVDRLVRRGVTDVRLVTTEELVYSTRLVHRLASGRVTTEVTLPDGAVLGPGLHGALNRVVAVPSGHLAASEATEREYAQQEVYAVLTSVLASLPGAVNRAGPRGLPGPWLREPEWLCAAGAAGLDGVGFRSGRPHGDRPLPDRSVLVVGEAVLPMGPGAPHVDVPRHVAAGCRLLAERVGATILGVDLVTDGSSWLFARANPVPDLRWGGEAVADALLALLTEQGSP